VRRKRSAIASPGAIDERCPSGIEGLDIILVGGLPLNCFFLIQGDPGSRKTTLALQFLLEGLRRGEKVFYITLSETKDELLKVARSHGSRSAPFPPGRLRMISCARYSFEPSCLLASVDSLSYARLRCY
jgi:archaellum biogenesis ATPase FlaH